MVAKTGVTFDDERLKFQNDQDNDCAVNTIVSNKGGNPLIVDVVDSGEFLIDYNEINSVAGLSTVNVLTYTVPVGKVLFLKKVLFFGQNIGVYSVDIDSNIVAKLETYYTKYNDGFDFKDMPINSGSILKLIVSNKTNSIADFNATIIGRLEYD